MRSGNVEVGGFVGSSYGVDKWRVMGGGNVSYAATRYLVPYVEYSYFPGIGRKSTVALGGGQSAPYNFSIPISDFHGGVHLRFPIGQSRVVPYLVLGAGGLRIHGRTETVTVPGGSIPVTFDAETRFAVNGGGGLRFYVNERLGFRAESKIYKPTGDAPFDATFSKVEFGIFFQLR